MLEIRVLPRSFYDRPTLTVAEELLGKVLVHSTSRGIAAGMIVEAEGYIGEDDPACHAAPGPTARNELLYGPPGLAYVYLNYGIHHLFNVVTEAERRPAAVLIRALAPVEGVALMRRRRAINGGPEAHLCRGPGNLTQALGITLSNNRTDLVSELAIERARRRRAQSARLVIEDRGFPRGEVAWGPRIGIRVGTDRPWRCWIAGHPSVSGTRR